MEPTCHALHMQVLYIFTLIFSCLENLNRFVCGVARVRGDEKWVRFGLVGSARGLRTGKHDGGVSKMNQCSLSEVL